MTFAQFKDKARWAGFAGAVAIFGGQWLLHQAFVDRIAWVDNTPPLLNLLGLLATAITFLIAMLTIPRWHSFVAIGAVLWVVFIWIQGI
jgi:hypothetical protein